MIGFLRSRAAWMQNARIVSTAQCSLRTCSFCNYYHFTLSKPIRYALHRHYATIDTQAEHHVPVKKKLKHHSRKYTEILEVTDQVTNSKRAAVRRLNSSHVSILVGQSDITLDKLHKIGKLCLDKKTHTTQAKDTSKTKSEEGSVCIKGEADNVQYAILKESDEYLGDKTAIVEELKESSINNDTLIKDSSFVNTLHQIDENDDKNITKNALTQVIKYNEVSDQYIAIPFTIEHNQFEDSLVDQNLVAQFLAHMDVYIHNGMLNRAFKILLLNRYRLKNSKAPTIMLYNKLMEAYVTKPHLEKVFEIYNFVKEDSVKPDMYTFAYILQIVGKMKANKKRVEIITQLAEHMNREDISFDDVMNITEINMTQRDIILQCFKILSPQYRVAYREIDTAHDCKLLRSMTANNSRQSPAKGLFTMDELQKMMTAQINVEKQHAFEVKSIALFSGDPDIRQQAKERIAEWEKSWELSVAEAFEKNLFYLKQKELRVQPDLKTLHLFLEALPKQIYVDAILREIKQLARSSDAYSNSLQYLYLTLGKYIHHKYEKKKETNIMDNIIQIYNKYLKWYLQQNLTDKNINGRIMWQKLTQEAHKSSVCSHMAILEWPRHILVNIGKFLYNIIVNDVKISYRTKPGTIERQIPAFYLLFRNKTKFLTEEIKPHPHLHRLFNDAHPEGLIFETTLSPTYVPPRPWVDVNIGGYLFSKTDFVRDPYVGIGSTHLLKNISAKQLYPAFDCLNQLGSIPWRINKPMLDILIQIFREGGSEELNVPQPPSVLPALSELIQNLNENEKDRNNISRLRLQLRRRKNEMYSLWCDCLYKLSLANHFRDKLFWLPHNLDFRGRTYPVPPHLTHLSSDLGRSILTFAQKKPLGPKGLDWLKIHTINLTGIKKRESIHKRLEYANEMLDQIIDSARNPLTGKKWWTKSDEPWQTLAACKEIDNALQSPNVEEYMCSFPIHQDGSCNGLQHYAALGRDQVGAESVNLYPSDMPQDVYSVVVSMVEEYRKQDAKTGSEIAKALEGHITRKVIKQTVMTTVYGVTKFGARLQIARQLSDLKDFNQEYIWSGSLYLVEMTFKSLHSMFTSAREIQDWFTDCARVISTRCNQYVQWITPLGLPVVQPYCKRSKSFSKKYLKKPDTLKQKNAFPPNFIHSLDSCHMMLTSLHCEQAGITFISVHDCFWTHPCSVEIMSKICRKQFVALHNEPILEDLSKYLCHRYDTYFTSDLSVKRRDDFSLQVFKKLPKKGDFDINGVLSSQYFFS